MLLQLGDLNKNYTRNGRVFPAVENVNLSANNGEFISIIGRSGSGKSTLLNLIAGLLAPDSGEVLISGKSTVGLSDKEASLLRNSVIGYIPQGQSLLQNLTVWDNIRLPLHLGEYTDSAEERTVDLLRKLGIEHLADSYPSGLSGGEMRRAVIARALINNPAIILADEPTSDLDAECTKDIMELFKGVAKSGTLVIMVTHELDTTEGADRVYTMDRGQLSLSNRKNT